MIDSVWAAFVEVGARPGDPQGDQTGGPFRRWRCSPPVVKWGGSISGSRSSQGETSVRTASRACRNRFLGRTLRLRNMETKSAFRYL